MSRGRGLHSVPDRMPDESFASHAELMATHRESSTPYVQEALAVDFSDEEDGDALLVGPQPTDRAQLPDPHPRATHLAQAVVEVLSGTRTPVQLLRWTSPEVYAVLARRALLAQRRARESGASAGRRRPVVVRRVLVCEPRDGIAEVTVVVVDGGRVRALAMRLAGYDGDWRIVVLQLG